MINIHGYKISYMSSLNNIQKFLALSVMPEVLRGKDSPKTLIIMSQLFYPHHFLAF
jgi:hypothetical protein